MEAILLNQSEFQELKNSIYRIERKLEEKSLAEKKGKLNTPKETMSQLKIKSPKTLFNYRDKGDLPSVQFGSKILFTQESIDAFISKYSIQ